MKTKNKILIIVTLVCVLVSSLAITSFAYLDTDGYVVRFPSASFQVYRNDTSGSVLVRSSTVRETSVNTGNALTGVRSTWGVLPLVGPHLSCRSNKSISCYVTDFVYPLYLDGVVHDLRFEWNLYANESVDISYPVLDSDSAFIEVGYYRWTPDSLPSYETRSSFVSTDELFSFASLMTIADSDDNDETILVTSVYFSLSNVYQEDYASEGDISYGSVVGDLYLDQVLDISVDSASNVRLGTDILNQAFLDASYDTGYNEGYSSGQLDGIQIGYDEGYHFGFDEGYDDGYYLGEIDGYDNGFSAGESQGLANGYLNGYNDGLVFGENQGFIAGKNEGIEEGYTEGYNDGLADGEAISAPENWFDGIFGAVGGFLGTNLFGDFSIGGVLAVIVGFSCFMWILKIFAGG